MLFHRLSAAGLAVALSTSTAPASPLDWPQDDTAMATHCAAILSAYGHAYELATNLSGRTDAAPLGGLPEALLQRAGGPDQMAQITAQAEAFARHADSVARTNFYPLLIGEGTPYLADDGRELVMAVQSCTDRYGL